MDNKNVLDKSPNLNENPRKQVNNFIKHINNIKSNKCEFIKIVYFINNMRIKLYEINQKYSEKELLNEDEKKILESLGDSSLDKFKDKMIKWKDKFPTSCENFKNKYVLKINELKESFNRNDKTILKDKSYEKKEDYMKDQYKNILPEMTEIIEQDIKQLIYEFYEKLIQNLPASLKQKLENLILVNKDFESNRYSSGYSDMMYNGAAAVTGGLSIGVIAIVGGPPGWIFGGLLVVLSGIIYLVGKKWEKSEIFDEIVQLFYDLTIKNLDAIKNSSLKNYNDVITKFKNFVIKSKETLKEILILKDILEKYNLKRNKNSDETFEDVFKKLIEENLEIKDILDKI